MVANGPPGAMFRRLRSMESMRSTWTDSRLDDFAANTNQRFDKIDRELGEIRAELGALNRTIIQFAATLVAAQIATMATIVVTAL